MHASKATSLGVFDTTVTHPGRINHLSGSWQDGCCRAPHIMPKRCTLCDDARGKVFMIPDLRRSLGFKHCANSSRTENSS
mmetsp:Transcript_124806/g.227035  ORF Transcript_124806/g.227035 Transcript_124806/m.227035 type:complete len:80 (-) Transcript_124806:181-420(-)